MRLKADCSGAITVEFLIAFLPLLVFFQCLVQLSGLAQGRLAVLHAASCATRAAIVVLPDDPREYGGVPVGSVSGKRREDIELAAAIPLRANKSFTNVRIALSPDGQVGRDDSLRVEVIGTYRCEVPLAQRIVCNPMTGTREMTASATLPNQGADYRYEPGGPCVSKLSPL